MSVYPDSKVLIILVNYNGYSDTIECIGSLLQLEHSNFQIIVIDNDSPNNSLVFIREWAETFSKQNKNDSFFRDCSKEQLCTKDGDLDRFKLITVQAESNLGFAGGNNIGLKYGLENGFNYYWLLNNDTVVKPNTLSALLESINRSRYGILGSKLLYYDNSSKVQALGGKYNKLLAVSHHIAEGQSDSEKYSSGVFESIDYVVGASMIVSNDFLQDVGLLSEDYFLYFEELDWALRAKSKGWKIGTALSSVVIHKEGASAGSGHWSSRSMLSDLLIFRNRFIFTSKFHSWCLPFTYVASILIILNRFRRGQKEVGTKMLKYVWSLNLFRLETSIRTNNNIL